MSSQLEAITKECEIHIPELKNLRPQTHTNRLTNWLSDKMHFDEETADLEGAILEVDLTGIPTIEGAPWEHVIPSKISPKHIKVIQE